MFVSRREFVVATASSTMALIEPTFRKSLIAEEKASRQVPIVDTHTHFYDPTRPQGVPFPSKNDVILYRTVLPAEFKKLTSPYGVIGTVIIEASPWIEDNQWLLDLASNEPFIRGIVGNLAPGTDSFRHQLARFSKNPIFRGIRINSNAAKDALNHPEFLADLQRLCDSDLELDINGGPDMLPVINELAGRLPRLRIVINHLANVRIDGKEPPAEWVAGLKSAAKNPEVFLKVSAILENARIDGRAAPGDTEYYRPVLQTAWNAFGEDRLIYGSDWPVSDVGGPYDLGHRIVSEYFRDHGIGAMKKFFMGNAEVAYGFVTRGADRRDGVYSFSPTRDRCFVGLASFQ